MTDVLIVNASAPEAEDIRRAARCLQRGGLVAFPTETVYGLGANALDATAVRRVFAAKGRPASDPLIIHVAGLHDIEQLVSSLPPAAEALAQRFWPGPLTMVLSRSERVPPEVTAGGKTVAVRVPAHPVAQALLKEAGIPVAAPSANLFSRPSPTLAKHVLDDLGGLIDIVLDGGPTQVGLESTVLDLTSPDPTVLRPGAVTIAALQAVLSSMVVRTASSDDASPARSPGLLDKHYSPRAVLTLYRGEPRRIAKRMLDDALEISATGRRVGALVPNEMADAFDRSNVTVIRAGSVAHLEDIASRLYASLRELDAAGVDVILAADVSASEGLGPALRDRLTRAAAGRVVDT